MVAAMGELGGWIELGCEGGGGDPVRKEAKVREP